MGIGERKLDMRKSSPCAPWVWLCSVALHSKQFPDLSELMARMVAFEKDRERG